MVFGPAQRLAHPVLGRTFGAIERAVRGELEAGRVLDSVPGQVALVLARLMDRAGHASGSSVAAWSRELSRAMAEAEERAAAQRVKDDPLEALRRRREARRQR